jgi:opacity protein-like surface antigen
MRVEFSSSRAIGLGLALLLGVATTARGQQQDPPRRTTSTRRIPVTKDRPARPAPPPVATQRVNQDSIATAERARQDSIAAAERSRQDSIAAAERARQDQMRRDSITAADRAHQDSIAAADAARQDSIARAQSKARSNQDLQIARRRNSGFYMGVAGGSTMPMGELKTNLNNSYNTGWNVTVPFGWDFSSFPLGLRFDLAMDNLTGKPNFIDQIGNPTTPRNIAIYSGSAGLKLNVPLFRTASRFYLIGGAGAHRITGYATSQTGSDSAQTIQNAKTDIGWYGGAGFNFRFGRSALFLESRYINVDTKQPAGFAYQKANYLPIILGFQF